MLLFMPAVWLWACRDHRLQIIPQALCQSTLRLKRGVNGRISDDPFGLKAMVAKEACRVIGWALKCRLYLGRAMPSFFIRD